MCDFSSSKEVHPVALTEGVHIQWIFPLNFVGLPVPSEDVIAAGLQELLGGEIGNSMFVLCIRGAVPTGSMIFFISK